MKADQISVSVVLVGTFQPSRFSLDELERAEALSKSDIASARYLSLLPDQFFEMRLGTWGKLSASSEVMTIEVSEAPFIRAADLVLKCVREIAPNSVARKLGINTKCWYAFQDPKVRDKVGIRLINPATWGDWGKAVAESLSLPVTDPKHGGMMSAIMRQGAPDGRENGYIDVRIDSAQLASPTGAIVGIQTLINDHYEPAAASIAVETERVNTVKLLETLEGSFDESIRRSMQISDDVISGGTQR